MTEPAALPAPVTDLRADLRAAQSALAGLSDAAAAAADAADRARADVDRARSALDKFADVDGSITKHLAGLHRVGAPGASRAALPRELLAARQAKSGAVVDLSDAEAVLDLLTSEANAAAVDLERGRVAVRVAALAVAAADALALVATVQAHERAAGIARASLMAYASARTLSEPEIDWSIRLLAAEPHHEMMLRAYGGPASQVGAKWATYRVALLQDAAAELGD